MKILFQPSLIALLLYVMDDLIGNSLKGPLGIVAIALTIAAFIPYIRSIHCGGTKPHAFSWIIWGTTTIIVFAAQVAGDGGAGAWSTGVSGLITFYVALLAYLKRGDYSTTRTDWIFLAMALAAIPAWYFTSSPLSAVVILTTVDILGYGPTIRKAYFRPYEEQTLMYNLMTIRNMIGLAALEHYSATTTLFFFATAIANIAVVTMIYRRRRAFKPKV